MRAENIGKSALAKRLDVTLPRVDRLLDPQHHSRLNAIEWALSALVRHMRIGAGAAS